MNIPVRILPETDEDRAERLAQEAWEQLREECLEEFGEWQRATEDYSGRRNNPREDADFGNWLADRARSGNRYHEAMNWRERGRAA